MIHVYGSNIDRRRNAQTITLGNLPIVKSRHHGRWLERHLRQLSVPAEQANRMKLGVSICNKFENTDLYDEYNEHKCQRDGCNKVTINVSGLKFETTERTLWRLPDTLLGNSSKLRPYWDDKRQEYFFDRHRPSFAAILFFYQSGGKLNCPMEVPMDIFVNELRFFQIGEDIIRMFLEEEGYIFDAPSPRPTNPIKKYIWELYENPTSSLLAKIVSIISVVTIIVSIAIFCAETVTAVRLLYCRNITRVGKNNKTYVELIGSIDHWESDLFVTETLCVIYFTIEYCLRFISCPSKKDFLLNFLNAIDLSSILPYYLLMALSTLGHEPHDCLYESPLAGFAIVRSLRMARIFKLAKHFKGLHVLVQTLKASSYQFFMFVLFFTITMITFASVMYYVETSTLDMENPNDEAKTKFKSIPHAFWYVVISMTTVGYGDMYPVSYTGKVVGSLCVITGVLVIAIPVPVIVSNFTIYYNSALGRNPTFT